MSMWRRLFGARLPPDGEKPAATLKQQSQLVTVPEHEDPEQLMEEMRLLLELRDYVRDNLNANPLDWKLESPTSDVLVTRRTISVPGVGLLSCISFNCKITPVGDKYDCYLQSIAIPHVTETTETLDSLADAMRMIVERMGMQASLFYVLGKHTPRR